MDEDKNVEATEEDKKVPNAEKQPEPKSEGAEAKDAFVKENETVPAGKYNQAIRKVREGELEKRELQKQLEDAKKAKPEEGAEKKEEEEDFFKEEEESKVDPAKLIDEKLKPVLEANKKREENDKRIARAAFFAEFPQYLNNSEEFQALLEVLDDAINPHSKADYITQLRMAHSIRSGETASPEIEDKKKEIATDAAASGDGAEKASVKEEFTAEDRKYQKEWGISDEGLRAYKKKVASGSLRILT